MTLLLAGPFGLALHFTRPVEEKGRYPFLPVGRAPKEERAKEGA